MIERLFYNYDEILETNDEWGGDGRWSYSSVGWSWKTNQY